MNPDYRTINGKTYVLISKAAAEMVGCAGDTIEAIARFVETVRPDDSKLVADIRSLKPSGL